MKIEADDIATLYHRGMANEKTNQFEQVLIPLLVVFISPSQAIQDYTRVLELEPANAKAAYRRAACQNRIGNFQQAIEDYQLALERDNEVPHSPHHDFHSRTGRDTPELLSSDAFTSRYAQTRPLLQQLHKTGGIAAALGSRTPPSMCRISFANLST